MRAETAIPGAAEYIQVGVTAMRGPDGGFLPAVPLYVKATPEVLESEDEMITDIATILKDKMKQYIEGGGYIPKTGRRKAGRK